MKARSADRVTVASITAELSTSCAMVDAPDGNPIVHVGDRTVAVVHNADHAWLNVRGNVEGMPAPAGAPIACRAGDCLILARACSRGIPRPDFYPESGKSEVAEAVCIAFVGYPPSPRPLFRGFGIGGSQQIHDLRSVPMPLEMVGWHRLPSVIEVPPEEVDVLLPFLERVFGGFCGEVRSEWGTETITPDRQHIGYGSRLASAVSLAAILLVSTIPLWRKRTLALGMIQWGIDLAGAFLDGRFNKSNGGHMQGRKALVILAGHLLGLPEMANPDARNRNFQETAGYSQGAWWFGGDWNAVWHPFGPGSGAFVQRPPATWSHDSGGRRGERFFFSYAPQVLGCQVGTAVAMRLLGREREMGLPYCRMIDQWMQGPPQAAVRELAAVDLSYPWGHDYVVGPGGGVCAAAWRQVNPESLN